MAKEAASCIESILSNENLNPVERVRLERMLGELRGKQSPHEHQPSNVDLRQQTYELLKRVCEPSSDEQKEFIDRGFIFLTVRPITLPQVIEEDPDHFIGGELKNVNLQPGLRDYVLPSAMLIAVKPTELFIPGSFDNDRPTQLAMTQARSKEEIETISPAARSVMLPTTGLAQLDKAYKAKTDKDLFTSGYVRALDNTYGLLHSATIGRIRHGHRLTIIGSRADSGTSILGAASTIVFIRK